LSAAPAKSVPHWLKRNKYGVAPADERTYKGILFASKGEMLRYQQLELLEACGHICNLQRQVRFPLHAGDPPVKVATIVLDFVYDVLPSFASVYEDVKGDMTRDWQIKMKMWNQEYGGRLGATISLVKPPRARRGRR
jgi:Protein of unknown function (DUF1064)